MKKIRLLFLLMASLYALAINANSSGLTWIGGLQYRYYTSLTYCYAYVTVPTKTKGPITIPSQLYIEGHLCKVYLTEGTFRGCNKITSVTFDGSDLIHDYSKETDIPALFEDCDSLEAVYFPKHDYKNYDGALYYSTKIIFCPASFKGNYQTLLSKADYIGERAFQNNHTLYNVTLRGKDIGKSAFQGCSNLKSIILKGCTLGNSCFKDCPQLAEVKIEEGLEFEDHIFENTNITELIIPEYAKPQYNWKSIYIFGNDSTERTVYNLTRYNILAHRNVHILNFKSGSNGIFSVDTIGYTGLEIRIDSDKLQHHAVSVDSIYITGRTYIPTNNYVRANKDICSQWDMTYNLTINGKKYQTNTEYLHTGLPKAKVVIDNTTQSTITGHIEATNNSEATIDKYAYVLYSDYNNEQLTDNNGNNSHFIISNLGSNRKYDISPVVYYKNSQGRIRGGEAYARTKSIEPYITIEKSTPTAIVLKGSSNNIDAVIVNSNFTVEGNTYPNNELKLTDLEIGKTYEATYQVKTIDSTESCKLSFTTPNLQITTIKDARAISNTAAIICASTNLDDSDTHAGFEWRRYDAPELVPSSRANCPVVDGVMMGALKNLSSNTYYKFRPYYKDTEGTEYFGEWSAFGTADAYVYFEPTVRTYSINNIEDTRAEVRGFAIAGSDPIVEQGFEYWESDNTNSTPMYNLFSANNKQIVNSEGQWMSATLENLNSNATYTVRAFVKTEKGTTYGEQQTFTTTSLSGNKNILRSSEDISIKLIGQERNCIKLYIEGLNNEGKYQIYSINGTLVCSGTLDCTETAHIINIPNLTSGMYLLKVISNKQCKTLRFVTK